MKYDTKALKAINAEVRKGIFETVKSANSGHIGGCSSSVELMTGLYFGHLNYDLNNSKHPSRDRVLVRGHLGPLRYKIFSMLDWMDKSELENYRKIDSKLEGHEKMTLPGVDITPSGSLGMLLSYGTGAAIAAKKQNQDFRTYVFLGDGEEQEGNVSEAARHASSKKLENLVCIIDKNGKQLSRRTAESDGGSDISQIWRGYGWDVREINNGNDVNEVLGAYEGLKGATKPVLLIANTIKGYGLNGASDNFCGYHTITSCDPETVNQGISAQRKIIQESKLNPTEAAKKLTSSKCLSNHVKSIKKDCQIKIQSNEKEGSQLRTLSRYGEELQEILENKGLNYYFLTADLIRKNEVEKLGIRLPTEYIDVGIREQHMLAMAHGISQTDPASRIMVNANDSFMYRSLDQLHAISQAKSPMVILGGASGLSGAENGETHQSASQPGALLHMDGIRFLEPSDSEDLVNCMNLSLTDYTMPTYIRLHTLGVENIDAPNKGTDYYEAFKSENKPAITLIGSGLTVPGCIDAAKALEIKGVGSKVINVVNPKGLDSTFNNLIEENVPALTVYNGNQSVLQSAVSSSIMSFSGHRPSSIHGHGFKIGKSGSLDELVKHFGFDGNGIANFIKENYLINK